ncbi:MAG TPA: sulfatase-like hydrolase/transferase [Kofleriaceae bacterium]|nr:sulfatase-like hydrolase/transferase [Kofleriaceae bacterium]
MKRYDTTGAALRSDLRRGLVMASWAALVLLPVEYVATLRAYPGAIDLGLIARVAALCTTLVAIGWAVLAPVTAIAIAAPRAYRALTHERPRGDDGFLRWQPRPNASRPGAAWAWAIFLAASAYGLGLQRIGAWAINTYKEPQRTALLIAAAAVVGAFVAIGFALAVRRVTALAGELVYPIFGPWSPVTSWRGAAVGTGALVVGAMIAVYELDPSARPDLPWRALLDLYAIGGGLVLGAWRASRPRRPERARRMIAIPLALGAAALIPLTLVSIGAEPTAKYAIVTSSPLLDKAIGWIRRANDFDRDGFGSLLGENDCAPFDVNIHPGAEDKPDDGIDQNCDGHDFSLRALASVPEGPHMPVPAPFDRKDWNVLFITIDAVRFDHTTFGGYDKAAKHRDTTPNLAKLAAKSTNFTFAVAAAPGTMASVPAIITSKFFHNGLALEEHEGIKPGMPPRLKDENTLVTEIFHDAGYTTGEILTHEYFADWGMTQGVDDPDLEMTKDTDPFKVTSHMVTDHILAWISRHTGKRWFLWAHYLDPHGRYVAHPDDVEWSATEEDKYDSEIFYTDKHIGRLLDELQHIPGGDRTIVIITSDHGDGFMEHGYINHGNALYQDLLHVPMIIYVPGNPPRAIDNEAVSGLDLVPTIADLCGIDTSSLSFEGKSLVPEIFYGKTTPDRVVFSETNWPKRLRSETSRAWKLIFDLDDNLYELYDLASDPGEKSNVVGQRKDQFEKMKGVMDAFLERVVFARSNANQMMTKIGQVLIKGPVTPAHPIDGVAFDGGRIVLRGWEPDTQGTIKPGDKFYAKIYFEVIDTPSAAFRLQMEGWPITGALDPKAAIPPQVAPSPLRFTLDGGFSSDHWRKGDWIRERFGIIVPNGWSGDQLALGVWMMGDKKLEPTGPTPANDHGVAVLGTVPFAGVPPTPPVNPPPSPPTGPILPQRGALGPARP